MTAKMSDVMAMAGETLARSALVHLHRVGVLFLAVIGQERARASASCVSSSSPSLGRNALVLTRTTGRWHHHPSAQDSEAGLLREGACHRCRWVPLGD